MGKNVVKLFETLESWELSIGNSLLYNAIVRYPATSKMRKFQTVKLSQLHQAKTCWTEMKTAKLSKSQEHFQFIPIFKTMIKIDVHGLFCLNDRY